MMIDLMFRLLVAHALSDFSLQTDAMAKGKNRNKKPSYIPQGQKYVPCWPYWLSAHALISGGGVYIASGSLFLGIVESVLHWVIDFAKCDSKLTPNQDQALHFICRAGYVVFILWR